MKYADFSIPVNSSNSIGCILCPHNCIIKDGKSGICNVRKNSGGKLITTVYNKISSLHPDPIEKKPLYHYYPGKEILSVGSVGCNLKCRFCQNWEISQISDNENSYLKDTNANEIVDVALTINNNIGIAYTYNEPIVWFEFMYEIAKLANENGLKNVMVSNGFINKQPFLKLLNYIDAFSIDLKAFTTEFYKEQTSSELEPVKSTIKEISSHNKYLEITNLLIPGLNDNEADFREMVNWIAGETGENTVLHLSRYFPMYKMTRAKTPERTLLNFYEIAKEKLNFVYVGNLRTSTGQNTYCPNCSNLLIKRLGYNTEVVGVDRNGDCSKCNAHLSDYGIVLK